MKIISIVRYVAVVVMGIIFGMSIALHVRGSIQTHTANAESPVSTNPLVSFYYKFKELIMPSKSRTSDHSHSQISGPSSKGETQPKTNAHDVSEKITSIERSHMTPNEANIVGTDAMTAGEHHSDLIHFTFLGPRSSQLLSGISENEKNIFEAISNDVLSLRKTVTKVTTAVSSKSDLTSNVSKDEAIIDRGRDKSRKIINNRLEVGGIGAVTKALPFSGDKSPPLSDSNAVSYTHPPVTVDAQSSKCPYSWRVFVYDVPPDLPSVAIGRAARRDRNLHVCQKCILEQFSLEYIFQDFFTQTPCRVRDPAHADYFYLPIIRDAEFRVALDPSNTAVKDRRASSDTEIALLELMEKNRSAKFEKLFNIQASMQQYASGGQVDGMHWWHRHGGADHIFVMPAPVTNLRHQGGMRGFFHYMSHLKPPIFLGVEYSLSFLAEYPVCAAQKNVMVPYPTTDPDLFSGKLHADPVERHSLLYYAGGMHGDCVGVRRALKQLMHNGTVLNNAFKHEERTSSDPLPIVPRYASSMKEREHGFRAAVFCPIPIGDSPSSKRMYDVMHFGCIPVILSDDMAFAFTRQAGGHLDEQAFAVRLPQSVVQYPTEYLLKKFHSPKARQLFGTLPDGTLLYSLLQAANKFPRFEHGIYVNPLVHILRQINAKNVETLRAAVEAAAPLYTYYKMDSSMRSIPTATGVFPNGGAIDTLARALDRRKQQAGIDAVREACERELSAKHAYRGNYPCDKDDGNSLYRRVRRMRHRRY